MSPRRDRRAYILVLPSMFTTGNLFCGFYSILQSINGNFERASYAILLAGIFDLLDGRVARMTQSTSEFGVEYDSIADVVSFGMAPALLAYLWMLSGFGRVGWVGAFIFVACGALRLARFNVFSEELPKSYFLGLPTPAAAILIATSVLAYMEIPILYPDRILLGLVYGVALLMVSNVRYRSFKDFDIRHKRSFFHLVLLVLVVGLIALKHELSLFLVVAYYVSWAPVREIFSWAKRSAQKRRSQSYAIKKNQDTPSQER